MTLPQRFPANKACKLKLASLISPLLLGFVYHISNVHIVSLKKVLRPSYFLL